MYKIISGCLEMDLVNRRTGLTLDDPVVFRAGSVIRRCSSATLYVQFSRVGETPVLLEEITIKDETQWTILKKRLKWAFASAWHVVWRTCSDIAIGTLVLSLLGVPAVVQSIITPEATGSILVEICLLIFNGVKRLVNFTKLRFSNIR